MYCLSPHLILFLDTIACGVGQTSIVSKTLMNGPLAFPMQALLLLELHILIRDSHSPFFFISLDFSQSKPSSFSIGWYSLYCGSCNNFSRPCVLIISILLNSACRRYELMFISNRTFSVGAKLIELPEIGNGVCQDTWQFNSYFSG